jgi:PAS domain S-box-containing protein
MFTRSFGSRTITSWNEGAERLYGWTRDEAIGKKASDLLCSRYPIPIEQIEQELKDTGRWQGQVVQCRKDGSEVTVEGRWGLQVDAAGQPLAILEINTDLTAHRDALARLAQSEERFRLLVSAVVDYAIFMLDRHGVVSSWNEGAQRIKGYASDEIIGQSFAHFYTPEDQAAGRPQRNLELAAKDGSVEDEGWRVRKDGSRFWASVVITALRDDQGTLRGFGKVTRDITDKHFEEKRLRDYAEQMAELEKAKAQFLDLAAHELRGPLTLIRGYNSLLRDGSLANARIPQVARMLEGKLEQIDLLVQQMLEMGRLENDRLELHFEEVDLSDLAAEQIERLRPLAPGRDVTLSNKGVHVIVNADRSRVGTIVANLIDNAIKYSPAGGPVECEVGRQGGQAFVSVSDTGIGIAEDHMPLLFKRFSRLPTEENKTIPGTGLALYLCQEIARRHGGEITVTSKLAEGSEFRLQLPAAP